MLNKYGMIPGKVIHKELLFSAIFR